MADDLYCWNTPYQHFLGYHLSRQLKSNFFFLVPCYTSEKYLSCPVKTEGKAWKIAMLFDGVFKPNLNLMGRKPLFFRDEAYWEHAKILSQMGIAMQWVSVPQRATDYLHDHSGLMCQWNISTWYAGFAEPASERYCRFHKVLHSLIALGQNFFCLFLRILAEYLIFMGNFICFMRRRTGSSWVPDLYNRAITLFWHCSSSWISSCLQQVTNLC